MERLRSLIDELDDELVTLIARRSKLALEIASLKDGADDEAGRRWLREKQVVDRVSSKFEQAAGEYDVSCIEAVYQAFFSSSEGLHRRCRKAALQSAVDERDRSDQA